MKKNKHDEWLKYLSTKNLFQYFSLCGVVKWIQYYTSFLWCEFFKENSNAWFAGINILIRTNSSDDSSSIYFAFILIRINYRYLKGKYFRIISYNYILITFLKQYVSITKQNLIKSTSKTKAIIIYNFLFRSFLRNSLPYLCKINYAVMRFSFSNINTHIQDTCDRSQRTTNLVRFLQSVRLFFYESTWFQCHI